MLPNLIKPVTEDIGTVIEGLKRSRMERNQDIAKLEIVQAKLLRMMKEAKQQSIPNMVVAFLFGVWPFLQSLASYMLPLVYCSGTFVSFIFIITADSSSRRRTCWSLGAVSSSAATDQNEKTNDSRSTNQKATATTTNNDGHGNSMSVSHLVSHDGSHQM